MAKTPAGFYDDGHGRKRWWDGTAWTDQYEAIESAVSAATTALFSFVSHIEGFNARVQIWPDRIEWEKNQINSAKMKAAVLTLGTSALLTRGVRTKNTDMIPMKMIAGVTSKKGAGFNTVVSVRTAGGVVEFRANHGDATTAMKLIQKLMLDSTTVNVVVAQAPAAAPAPIDDIPAQIGKLKDLLDAGVLTQAEFDAKKTELLARI